MKQAISPLFDLLLQKPSVNCNLLQTEHDIFEYTGTKIQKGKIGAKGTLIYTEVIILAIGTVLYISLFVTLALSYCC